MGKKRIDPKIQKLQSKKWDSMEKCKKLQNKWGDYNSFSEDPNKSNKIVIINELKRVCGIIGKESSVLEVGCGAGHFMWVIKDLVKENHGMDYSKPMLTLTKEQFEKNNYKVFLKQGSCWNLPYNDNSFDFVFQVDVCMHIGGSWESIKEMIRVSKRFVFFTGPSFENFIDMINKKISGGKRWSISVPLLKRELEIMKKKEIIKEYKFFYREPTKYYNHKILIIEKI